MKYFIDGAEVTREAVKAQLLEELREAETRPTFQGRIFYNIDYIERIAAQFMEANGKNYFIFDDVRLEKN